MILTSAFRSLLVPVVLVGAVSGFVAGCGDSDTKSDTKSGKTTETVTETTTQETTLDELGDGGQKIQEKAESVQQDAQEIGDDVKSGKISPAKGRKLLRAKAKELQKEAEAAGAEAFGDDAK